MRLENDYSLRITSEKYHKYNLGVVLALKLLDFRKFVLLLLLLLLLSLSLSL